MSDSEQQADSAKTRIVLAYIFGNLPERVHETLRQQGRSQRQFCRETDFPRSTLTDILNNRHIPTLQTVRRLAEALGR